MKTVRGAKLVITGAASGMGLLYAKRAVSEGAAGIALWDRDFDKLQEIQKSLPSTTTVSIHEVELASLASIQRAFDDTILALGCPDVLVNNAGIVAGNAYFWDADLTSNIEDTMRINTVAHMQVTRLFLPHMIADKHRPKRILNVASAAATVSNPRMSVYAASKWAMYGWSDSLRLELMQADHNHVRVTTFCPSYVSTGMFRGAKGMLLTPVITPNAAVSSAWSAMLAGKPIQLTPWAVNLAKVLRGLLPIRAWDKVAQMMGVYTSMSEFTGRTTS